MAFSEPNQQANYDHVRDMFVLMTILLINYIKQVQQNFSCCALELAYEKSLQRSEALYEGERTRRLRTQILLLEHNNDTLHEQLIQDEERIGELTEVGEDLKSQLMRAHNSLDNSHSDLRLKSREIETLKV